MFFVNLQEEIKQDFDCGTSKIYKQTHKHTYDDELKMANFCFVKKKK